MKRRCAGIAAIRPGPINGQGITAERYGILRDAVHARGTIFPGQDAIGPGAFCQLVRASASINYRGDNILAILIRNGGYGSPAT
jgi:hypothetical protein